MSYEGAMFLLVKSEKETEQMVLELYQNGFISVAERLSENLMIIESCKKILELNKGDN